MSSGPTHVYFDDDNKKKIVFWGNSWYCYR